MFMDDEMQAPADGGMADEGTTAGEGMPAEGMGTEEPKEEAAM